MAIAYTVDQVTAITTATTTTSNTVSVVSGNLIVVGFAVENGDSNNLDAGTPITNTGTAFTWTKFADTTPTTDTTKCRVALYRATATATQSCTVTHTKSSTAGGNVRRITTIVISGQDATTPLPVGNVKIQSTGAATASETITPTATGSLMFMVAADWNQVNSYTALTNNTVDSVYDVSGTYTTALIRPTSNPLSSGSAFTIGATCTGAKSVHAAFEVVAQGGSPYAMPAVTGAFALAGVDATLVTSQPTWTFIGITEAAVSASGNYTLTEPSGVAQNDLLIVDIVTRSTVIYTNGAWTFPQSDAGGNTTNNTTASDTSYQSGYCIRGASPPSYVFSRTGGSRALGTVRAYRSNKGAPIFDTSAKVAMTVANATITLTSGVTTAATNELIVTGSHGARAAATTAQFSAMDGVTGVTGNSGAIDTTTAPLVNTWTERSDRGNTTSPTVALACYDVVKSTTGSTGNLTNVVAGSALHGMVAMAFKHATVTHRTMPADAGAFALTGVDAALIYTALMQLDPAKTSANITLSLGNRGATRNSNAAVNYASTLSYVDGGTKMYVEVYTGGGGSALGISNATIADSDSLGTAPHWLGGSTDSIGFWDDEGNIYYNNAVAASIPAVAPGDYIGVAIDRGAKTVQFRSVTAGGTWSTPVNITSMGTGPFYFGFSLAVTNARIVLFDTFQSTSTPTGGYTRWNGSPLITVTHYTMPAAAGAFTLAGQTAVTRYGHKMPAVVQTFALAGQTTALRIARKLPAVKGTFTLAGQAAALRYGHAVVAVKGTFTLAGQTTALRASRMLPALKGTFTLAGQAAGLRYGHRTVALAGAFTLDGKPAALNYSRKIKMAAVSGAFTLNGQPSNLVYSGSGDKGMPAAVGTFTLAGQTATLTKSTAVTHYTMPAAVGAVTVSGKAAVLYYVRRLVVEPGAVTVSGKPAGLNYGVRQSYTMTTTPGVVRLEGVSATLSKTYAPPPIRQETLRFGRSVYVSRW